MFTLKVVAFWLLAAIALAGVRYLSHGDRL